jgi:hypothetical protein
MDSEVPLASSHQPSASKAKLLGARNISSSPRIATVIEAIDKPFRKRSTKLVRRFVTGRRAKDGDGVVGVHVVAALKGLEIGLVSSEGCQHPKLDLVPIPADPSIPGVGDEQVLEIFRELLERRVCDRPPARRLRVNFDARVDTLRSL